MLRIFNLEKKYFSKPNFEFSKIFEFFDDFLKIRKSEELATLVFFILTGYKFRPGCNNPYFKVEEEDLAEVVTKTAITEKVQKRKDKSGEKKVKMTVI